MFARSSSRFRDRADELALALHSLLGSGHRSFALLPAGEELRTAAVTCELGALLGSSRREKVVVVVADPKDIGENASSAARIVGRWMGEFSAVIAPPQRPDEGDAQRVLTPLLDHALGSCAYVLFDASSVRGREEQLAVARRMEALCVVAAVQRTKESELLLAKEGMMHDNCLGVLLV